ncbi:MAG: pyridoxal-phosphate dependent enzyme, partial [Acidimicrobiia bacterium]|nr:pyridoxal-phosphate dependent enzyme [Acidimicrobiia bacterium]
MSRLANIAVLPTPVQRMDSLAAALGTEATLLVKRDDLTGLALGGNKARKLALLAADALDVGADCLVTGGGPQSNHARMTAAAANQIGVDCHLALAGAPPAARDGNLLVDELLGAHVHFDGADDYYDIETAITTLADSLRASGRRPYAIPVGGASTIGVVAYALAVDELRGQVDADPEWIFVADGSGGTHAGLLAGLGDGSPTTVVGVDVGTRPDLDHQVPVLARAAAAHLGRGAPQATMSVDHDHIGRGYGDLSPACLDALRTVARTEGLILDPVYSGKAAAAMFTAVRDGRISNGDTVVFWATGGTPALFA